jgi:hypothetical protein
VGVSVSPPTLTFIGDDWAAVVMGLREAASDAPRFDAPTEAA